MQYLGLMDCQYYQGKVGEIDHKCCGGKISKWARIKCKRRGVVTAQDVCTQRCEYGPGRKDLAMMPKATAQRATEVEKAVSAAQPVVKPETNVKSEATIQEPDAATQDIVNASDKKPTGDSASNQPTSRPKTIWQLWAEELEAKKTKNAK